MRTLAPCICALMLMAGTSVKAAPIDDCLSEAALDHVGQAYESCTAAIAAGGLEAARLAQAYLRRGEALYRSHRLGQALEDVDQALKLNPKLTQALKRRAMIYNRFGRQRDAIDDLETALAIDENDADVLCTFGLVLATHNLSKPYYERALAIDPLHVLARLNLAHALFESEGDFEGALREVKHILNRDPRDVDRSYVWKDPSGAPQYKLYGTVRMERATMLHRLKRHDEAFADLEWLEANYPDVPQAFTAHGQFLYWSQSGETGKALAYLDKALAMHSQDDDARLTKAWIMIGQRRDADAAREADYLLSHGTLKPGQAYEIRALAHKGLGRRREALDDMERAFAADPKILRQMEERLIDSDYLEGQVTGEYRAEVRNGLMACIVDPKC